MFNLKNKNKIKISNVLKITEKILPFSAVKSKIKKYILRK
jgi:hypothetical protein